MTWYRVCLACAVSVALMACSETEQGVLQPQGPLAGLRYVNLVNDTSGVDFRIINFVGDAPNAGAATFRTGGAPYGVSTSFLPPHWPVEANRDVHIRVFMNDTLPALVSQVVFDTTLTFAENVNHTFFLYGSARGGAVRAILTVDNPAAPAGVAFRVINLGGTAVGAVDVDVVARATVAPLTGTASFPAVAVGATTAYTNFAVSGTYKATATAPTTRTPILFSAGAPAGEVGTATLNPVAGTLVAGSAISAVIVPASVTGSRAPAAEALRTTASLVRSNDTVTVTTSASHGRAVNDFINVTGANETEYNGPAVIIAVPTATSFRYLVSGTPASPATGTVGYRLAANDYTRPYIIFMIDRKPVLTAP
jgi:hypothetical protein